MGNQPSSFTYDVFLIYQNKDASFAEIIKKALSDRGIQIFIDNHMLSEGDSSGITTQHFNVMQNSRTLIIVFSENFFASSLCLQVLAQIIENRDMVLKAKRQYIVPVFYNVDPSDPAHVPRLVDYIRALQKQDYMLEAAGNKDTVLIKWRKATIKGLTCTDWKFNHGDGCEVEFINKFVECVTKNYGLRSRKAISQNIHEFFQAKTTWRVVGIMSTVVGMSCYALSPCFNRLFGRWNILKFFIFGLLTLAILSTIMFVEQSSISTRSNKLQLLVCFVVLIIISVYSFFYDRAVNGNPETFSVVSNVAFALASLSLRNLVNCGFEIGVFTYFLGLFIVQLLTINWMWIFVAIIFGFLLFIMHSSPYFRLKVVGRDQVTHLSLPL